MFEGVFDNDGKTAYVFTSDHGMTNWGMSCQIKKKFLKCSFTMLLDMFYLLRDGCNVMPVYSRAFKAK